MNQLNYHHLRYFREVAREGNLTRAAAHMNLSQSALSTQIKTLEDRLGHALFDRVGRGLTLTEVGQITLDHADRIFATGDDLLATLAHTGRTQVPLRVGALSTLSRNFQLQFLRPVLHRADVSIELTSGNTDVLLSALKALALDVVLSTEPPGTLYGPELIAQRLSQQEVLLHGRPQLLEHTSLRALLSEEPVILPAHNSIRTDFDGLIAALGVTPRIAAEVDDMAMMRLLAREGAGLAIAPSVVFADEIEAGRIQAAPFDLSIVESFFAVTVRRNFPHPLLDQVFDAYLA